MGVGNFGGRIWESLSGWLILELANELGPLDEKHQDFIAIYELVDPEKEVARYAWSGVGCPLERLQGAYRRGERRYPDRVHPHVGEHA